MAARLSIRSYTFVSHTHSHDHHQLVLPLVGTVDIHTGRHEGRAAPGQCIITLAGDEHRFAPGKGSCFLVADLDELPPSMQSLQDSFVRVSESMQAFCFFVQKQLEQCVSPVLERSMGEWFVQLMGEQTFLPTMDPRIARVVESLEKDLSASPSLAELASVAFLSVSQLKSLFKKETGKTTGEYLLTLRMSKARALLVHTDYPVSLIASQVGYQDLSAFSRRFASHFGYPPRKLRFKQ
ncbi:HTH-type transcriptional activator RhaR [compost metagenome]